MISSGSDRPTSTTAQWVRIANATLCLKRRQKPTATLFAACVGELIGHFCGAAEEEVAENESRLLRFLDAYAVAGVTKALQPIEVGQVSFRALNDFIQPIADPRIPLNLKRAANRMWTTRTILGTAELVLMLMALALLWRYTPLRYADIGFLSAIMS